MSVITPLSQVSVTSNSSVNSFNFTANYVGHPPSHGILVRKTWCKCWVGPLLQNAESNQLLHRSKFRRPKTQPMRFPLVSKQASFFLPNFPLNQLLRSPLMASKSHRLHHSTDTAPSNSAKKAKTTIDSTMKLEFENYTKYLNELNDKRERVVKASRDITMNSKKVIFQVHRISKHNREEVLEKAEKDLTAVTDQYISRLVKELQGTDFWKLRRAYSPGVQEYVEAATLCKFCTTGTLLNLAEINSRILQLSDPSLEPLQINVLDYLLGVSHCLSDYGLRSPLHQATLHLQHLSPIRLQMCIRFWGIKKLSLQSDIEGVEIADLTGELMRLAIGRISDGELEYAEKICKFVREIYGELTLVVPHMDDNYEMKKKMEVMLQSVVKIENACFSVHVRGSEYMPMLGSSDPNYSFLGGSKLEL